MNIISKTIKKALCFTLSLAMIISMTLTEFSVYVIAESSIADNNEIYEIRSAEDLWEFANLVNSGQTDINAKLMNDIDLSSVCGHEINTDWIPIGIFNKEMPENNAIFTGIFDGQNYSVEGLYINNSETNNQGLFGFLGSEGKIKNVSVSGKITAGNGIGGICGTSEGTITNCCSSVNINGEGFIGGICGMNGYNGSLLDCHNIGEINGHSDVGGICGANHNILQDCYNDNTVNGKDGYIGGVCGRNEGEISISYNSGIVTGGYNVGGINGINTQNGTIINCYNIGAVSGTHLYVDGICANNESINNYGEIYYSIRNCYNMGMVSYIRDVSNESCGNPGFSGNNCYYLSGILSNGYTLAKTAEQFASGEVCWLLNNGELQNRQSVWHQTIGVDNHPVLDKSHGIVYKYDESYSNCSTHEHIYYEGLCTICGENKPVIPTETTTQIETTETTTTTFTEFEFNMLKYIQIDSNDDGINDYIKITHFDDESAFSVDIPYEIDELPVKVIGESAFQFCDRLQNVKVPDSITTIEDSAFSYCTKLNSIVIPDSVENIGENAFSYCSNLYSITILNPKCKIANYKCTFSDSGDSFDGIIYGYKNSTAQEYAENFNRKFAPLKEEVPTTTSPVTTDVSIQTTGIIATGCTNGSGIISSDNSTNAVVTIGVYATTVKTEVTTTAIDSDLNMLKYVPIDSDNDGINDYIKITGCDKAAISIHIPSEIDGLPVKAIGGNAFYWCKSLINITIPDTIVCIGNGAFGCCDSLESIHIPETVSKIGDNAFGGCINLKSINISDGITKISDCTFNECVKLSEIIIPDSVKEIGESAFQNCINLKEVNIPDSVVDLGMCAFSGCTRAYLKTQSNCTIWTKEK